MNNAADLANSPIKHFGKAFGAVSFFIVSTLLLYVTVYQYARQMKIFGALIGY